MIKKMTVIILFAILCIMTGCSQKIEEENNKILTRTGFAFDTVVKISLYENGSEEILDSCFSLCFDMEKIFSPTLTEGELFNINENNLNKANFAKKYILSDDLYKVIKKGLDYSALSEGSFDISIRTISRLWNFTGDMNEPVSADMIEKVLPLVNYKGIKLDSNNLSFENTGMAIDLGAVAKGYIADKIKELLLARNVKSAVISLGGNILCVGKRPDNTSFQIGIQAPFSENESLTLALKVNDMSVVTSGIYERYFIYKNKLYHHILNPKDGYPFDNELASVSIISEKSIDGDALSTVVFSLGLEKGMEFIQGIENTYAVFVKKDGSITYSNGFPMDMIIMENAE